MLNPTPEALELLSELAKKNNNTLQLNQVAWFYAVSPIAELRNAGKAVELASLSVNVKSRKFNLDTYACALMANQEKEKALKIVTQLKLNDRIELFSQDGLCEDQTLFNGVREIASLNE